MERGRLAGDPHVPGINYGEVGGYRMTESTHDEDSTPDDPVLDPVMWIQVAADHPAVGGLQSLLTWAQQHFSATEIAEMARLSRALNADVNADITGYSTLEERLSDAGVEARILPLVYALLNQPGLPAVKAATLPFIPSVTTEALADLCQHLFGSAEIGLTGENYLGWARLAAGSGTVDDIRYLVHELHELLAVRAAAYKSTPRDGKIDEKTWSALYETHHLAATKAECEFLAGALAKYTGGEAAFPAEQIAAADPVRSEGRLAYFGKKGAAGAYAKTSGLPVGLSALVRQKLGIAVEKPTLSAVVAAFKALPAARLTG